MHITAETPREDFTIAGETFQFALPYGEGHRLSEHEARALNQVFGENIRNNMAKLVRSHKEAGTLDVEAMQSLIDAYMDKYEFGVRQGRGGGSRTSNPIKVRAIELAREAVRRKIREVGGSLKDYSSKDISERARKAVEANPRFLETAAQQIEDERGIDVGELDSPGVEGKSKRKAA